MRLRLGQPTPVLVVFTVLLLLRASAAAQTSRPLPPGQVAANQATRQAEKLEVPANPSRTISAEEVLQQADELASLAQQVRADTLQAAHGLLAKDFKDKLKRIEKLSKKLREELAP